MLLLKGNFNKYLFLHRDKYDEFSSLSLVYLAQFMSFPSKIENFNLDLSDTFISGETFINFFKEHQLFKKIEHLSFRTT